MFSSACHHDIITMKKPVNKTALALPSTIQPPPRKEDIINAMVERARVKHAEERQRLEALKEEAKEKLKAALTTALQLNPDNFSCKVDTWNGCCGLEFRLQVIPPHIEKLRKAYKEAPTLGLFDESAVKRKIREGMNTAGDRVKALLANPDAVKKLDAALTAISK